MKKLIALIAALLALGALTPTDAVAGHRYRYSRHHCHSGAAIANTIVYLAASHGGYGYGGYGYCHRPCYDSHYYRPRVVYYSRPRCYNSGYYYPRYTRSYYSYGYGGCRPRYWR